MSDKEDPKQVIHLPLIPISPIVERRDAWHWCSFIRVGLDSYPRVVPDAEKIVHDLESLTPRRIIHSRYIRHHCILGRGVILEERDDGDYTGWRDVDCELVLPDRELLNIFGHAGEKVLAVGVEAGGFFLKLVCWVHHWGVKLAPSFRNVLARVYRSPDLRNTHEAVGHAACWAYHLGKPHPLPEPLNRQIDGRIGLPRLLRCLPVLSKELQHLFSPP